jgi:CRISPR/Cas system CSM-associated protein Csm3 (group 7 of RAMP superfamily)
MNEEQHQHYETIRLVEKTAGELDEERGHHHLNGEKVSGRIRAICQALQPLHVGTGIFVTPGDVGLESDVPLVKSFHQVDGRLTIPGSSIKGAVRSLVEAMTQSCVAKTKDRLHEDYRECRYNSKRHEGRLCPACRIFGAMGYQGQVSFSDAPLVAGESVILQIPPQYQPKGSSTRRYYPHAEQDGRDGTWPLEVAQTGSRFDVEVRFQNLDKAEVGLLLLALGQGEPPICLKLGAGKSAGLGSVRFDELVAEQLDVAALYHAYDSESAWRPVDIADCVTAAGTILRKDSALRRLQADLNCSQVDR